MDQNERIHLTITPFKPSQQDALRAFVLQIQNGEFGLGFREEEQMDLVDTAAYFNSGGFWIAELDGEMVGCIGLEMLNRQTGILKKMFVKKELRGTDLKIAQQLYDHFISECQQRKLETILLDSPGVAVASHRFYEKNGFVEIDTDNIPKGYSYPDRNSKIFELKLN